MKNFTKVVLTIALFAANTTAMAQAQFYQNIQGTAIKENRGDGVEGSPYMADKWVVGSVNVEKGSYNDIKLKYDLKNDMPVFAGKDDVPMNFADPVKAFIINNKTFASGLPGIGALDKNSYYEVLSDGKTKLLKHYAKHIQESKAYGSSTMTREYIATEAYYVLKDNKMSLIKPDKKVVLEIMADKAAQIDAYLKINRVNFKNDTSLGALFDYYNGL